MLVLHFLASATTPIIVFLFTAVQGFIKPNEVITAAWEENQGNGISAQQTPGLVAGFILL